MHLYTFKKIPVSTRQKRVSDIGGATNKQLQYYVPDLSFEKQLLW